MAPRSDADNASVSSSFATSRGSAAGRLGDSSPTGLTLHNIHNIASQDLPHNSTEARIHAAAGGLGGTEHLSPGLDRKDTCNETRDSTTGAMSIKASTPTAGHVHGTLCQSNHRLNLFVDPYFHSRESLFFPQHTAGSSIPLFESTGYHQVSPAEANFNHLGVFPPPEYMPASPDRGPYSPQENYDRPYETSENTRGTLSQPANQRPESPLPLFNPVATPHGDLTGGGRHYSVGYGRAQSPHPDHFISRQTSEWFAANEVVSDNFYEEDFRSPNRFSHVAGNDSPDLRTPSVVPHPLGDGMQSSFSDAFSHLNRSLVVATGQSSTTALKNAGCSESGFPAGEAKYPTSDALHNQAFLPPVRRNSRRESADNTQSQQRTLQRPSHQAAFDSAPDHGTIPGCLVLIPIDSSQAGEASGITTPQDAPKKEKPKKKPISEEEKAAVKQNRLHGVCYRCKIYKEKCRGGFPCVRCKSLPLWQPVCVTMQFVEKRVFSRELYRAQCVEQRDNVKEWLEKASIVLISNGFQPTLNLWVNEYIANDAAPLNNVLWKGNPRSGFTHIRSTPFGILPANEPLLIPNFDTYLDDLIPLLISQLCSGGYDKVFIDTMNAAYRYYRKSTEGGSIILLALRIWAAQFVFFKHPWRLDLRSDPLAPADALGMAALASEDPALAGIIPLPVLLNQQLDSLIEKKTANLEHKFLTQLQSKLFLKRPPDELFGIYLAMFVYFTGLEEDTWSLETWNYCVKSTAPAAPRTPVKWPLKETPEVLLEKNMHLVDVLSAHFRGVSKGHVPPFPPEGKKVEGQGMEQKELEYVNTLAAEIKRRGDTLQIRRVSIFDPDNPNSLNMKFSCRLMITTD